MLTMTTGVELSLEPANRAISATTTMTTTRAALSSARLSQ